MRFACTFTWGRVLMTKKLFYTIYCVNIYIQACHSNFSKRHNHLEGLLNRLLGPALEFLIQQVRNEA